MSKKVAVKKNSIVMVIDVLPDGTLPVYDRARREVSLPIYHNPDSRVVLVTNPDEPKLNYMERYDSSRGGNFLVKLHPLTPEFCRSMARTIERGQEEDMSLGVLVVNKEKSTVGFFVR